MVEPPSTSTIDHPPLADVTGSPVDAGTVCAYCHLPVAAVRRRAPDKATGPWYCCYGCRLAAEITQSSGAEGRLSFMLTRLGVSAFLAMAVMAFAMYLYGVEVHHQVTADAGSSDAHVAAIVRYICLILATPVFFLLGVPIFENAVDQWRRGAVTADALVVIGVGAAYLLSYVATLTDGRATYFETACMVLVLMTAGRYLEAVGRLRASNAMHALESLLPREVQVERPGGIVNVPPSELRVGDRMVIRSGERIAADGVIAAGQAHVDEHVVTGESAARAVAEGDAVRAGAVNVDGALIITATAVGPDSTLGRMITLVEQAKRHKGRYERLADRIAAWFVPLTVALALIGAVLGWRRGGADEAVLSALAVMLIACPCALGLATPLAVWMGMGRAAEAGALFRGAEALEALAEVRSMAFDKTGTLTAADATVESYIYDGGLHAEGSAPLARAAGLATTSTHVLSTGVARYAARRGVAAAPAAQVQSLPGRGVVGAIDGEVTYLGSVTLMREQGLTLSATLDAAVSESARRGLAVTCVGWNGAVRGVFACSESMRPESRPALDRLRRLGVAAAILTGDHRARAERIAAELGVKTRAELTPEQKLEALARLRTQHGRTAMVGDGINDAPALAAADVGLAMGCGADIARESADVCLLGNDLTTVPWLVELARRTVRVIKVNLFWAFAYNVVGIGLALVGWLSPIFAAGAMVLSSAFVVSNSLRLSRVTYG